MREKSLGKKGERGHQEKYSPVFVGVKFLSNFSIFLGIILLTYFFFCFKPPHICYYNYFISS